MRFVQLTPDLAKQWDEIAHASDEAWLFHLYDWIDLEDRVWGVESKSFLVEHESNFIAIVPLRMNKKNKVIKSDIMGASGPALINGLDQTFYNTILKSIYEHIETIALENGSHRVEIYICPLAESSLRDRWQVNPLINFFYSDISTHTLIVDLTKDVDSITKDFSQVTRKKIRKAQKVGYTIQQASGVDQYYEVHCETYARTGVPAHPKDYFVGIYERICKPGYATVWEARDPQGNAVAFEIVALFKKKAFNWVACCRTQHLNLGVNYLLQNNSMLWAKRQGAEWFESGEVFPNIFEGKKQGLSSFKDKFGGEIHHLWQGRREFNKASAQTNVFKNWVRASLLLFEHIFKK